MNNDNETIFRAPHSAEFPYFIMSRDVAQNNNLSWEARGVLAYLLSKPDGWEINVNDLRQQCGRDKVYAILGELREARHLTLIIVRDATGQILNQVYQLHEHPFPALPDQAEPDRVNTDGIYNTENTENTENTDLSDELDKPIANEKIAAIQSAKATKRLSEPRVVQPHVALFDAWIAAIGKDTLPPGFDYGSYLRLTKKLAKDGVTPEALSLAASLYHTWAVSLPGRVSPQWKVDVMTNAMNDALALVRTDVTTDDVARFVKARYAETDRNGTRFWSGKLLPFAHVVSNIGTWLAEHPALTKTLPDGDRTPWYDDESSLWLRVTGGTQQIRNPETGDWQ